MIKQTLTSTAQQQIKDRVGKALLAYHNVPEEEKVNLEKQGINIASFIFDAVMPAIANLKLKRLLIIMEGGIGNMIMLTPALRFLRHMNPRLHITVLGKRPALDVIDGWDVVDRVIEEFDGGMYDLCFTTIWGKNTKAQIDHLLKQTCKAQLDVNLKDVHEAIQHLAICDFIDGFGELAEPHCQIAKPEQEINLQDYIVFGDTTLRNFGWERKHWPHYVRLAELIKKKFGYKIVLIGDGQDKKEAMEKTWPDNVIFDFIGKTTIPELAYLIKHAKMFVGNDTGPAHIAAAVGTKTYVHFGPTKASKNMPIGKDVHILYKGLPCSPCQYTDNWSNCENPCTSWYTAEEAYNEIFFPSKKKDKILLVGYFSGGALRNEIYIKRTLERSFGFKVIPYDIRVQATKSNPIEATNLILNKAIQHDPKLILISGGQAVIPDILRHIIVLKPLCKTAVWYVDNRGQVEQWFHDLSSVCNMSYWSTGDPKMLSMVFSQTQRPCEFLPIVPDENTYFPIEGEKDIDVLFVGTPHSKERIDLLKFLVEKGVNIQIYGNGEWPQELKSKVQPGVFDVDFNALLNRAKIVINQNILNNVPLYFSDRYFYPMATKTVGLNQYIPNLEDMFEDRLHMSWFNTPEECLEKINILLADETLRTKISEEGYKLYKEKYTLVTILKRIVDEL